MNRRTLVLAALIGCALAAEIAFVDHSLQRETPEVTVMEQRRVPSLSYHRPPVSPPVHKEQSVTAPTESTISPAEEEPTEETGTPYTPAPEGEGETEEAVKPPSKPEPKPPEEG